MAPLSIIGHAGGVQPIKEFKTGLTVPRGFTEPEWAVELLKIYYRPRLEEGSREDPWYRPHADRGYVGAYFDRWEDAVPGEVDDPDANRFTLEDIVAVQMLSVRVPAWVVVDLVERKKDSFAQALAKIPTDIDLWESDQKAEGAVDAALELEQELRCYHNIGATTAAKLLARKRPRLYPIYDSVVVEELGLKNTLFRELREEMQNNPDLRELCRQLGEEAGLPASISVLRIFDVVTWMGARG